MLVANLGRSMSTEFFGLDSNAKHPNHLAFEKSSNAAQNEAFCFVLQAHSDADIIRGRRRLRPTFGPRIPSSPPGP
ncbi:MAG: hypothetical protein JWO85_2258 [Candidatus Eremiobacteraeota bacterium]|nr:hypothetical protein [Candidatus Eremiobacteraeota bacterium]